MKPIPKRKPESLFKKNIIVIDSKTGKKRGFNEQEKADEYIESREEPKDFYCEFDKVYKENFLRK